MNPNVPDREFKKPNLLTMQSEEKVQFSFKAIIYYIQATLYVCFFKGKITWLVY